MNSDKKNFAYILFVYTHAQYYNVVCYVTGRMRDEEEEEEEKDINTISYVEHCTVVVELEQQLLVVVELVD